MGLEPNPKPPPRLLPQGQLDSWSPIHLQFSLPSRSFLRPKVGPSHRPTVSSMPRAEGIRVPTQQSSSWHESPQIRPKPQKVPMPPPLSLSFISSPSGLSILSSKQLKPNTGARPLLTRTTILLI